MIFTCNSLVHDLEQSFNKRCNIEVVPSEQVSPGLEGAGLGLRQESPKVNKFEQVHV